MSVSIPSALVGSRVVGAVMTLWSPVRTAVPDSGNAVISQPASRVVSCGYIASIGALSAALSCTDDSSASTS